MAKRLSTAPHTITREFSAHRYMAPEVHHYATEREARQSIAYGVFYNGYQPTHSAAAKVADSAVIGEPLHIHDKNGAYAYAVTITRTPKASK